MQNAKQQIGTLLGKRGASNVQKGLYMAEFDASMRGGRSTIGYRIISPKEKLVRECSFEVCNAKVRSVTDVECYALFNLIKCLLNNKIKDVIIWGDNFYVVQALYKNNKTNIYKLNECRELLRVFDNVKINWFPRENNKVVDRICKIAYHNKYKKSGGKVNVS